MHSISCTKGDHWGSKDPNEESVHSLRGSGTLGKWILNDYIGYRSLFTSGGKGPHFGLTLNIPFFKIRIEWSKMCTYLFRYPELVCRRIIIVLNRVRK